MNTGLIEANPLATPIEKPIGFKGTPWRPWTDQEIATFLDKAHLLRRRAVMVLLYTGLRRADATSLRRSDIKDGRTILKTSKTDAEVVIPIHSKLAEELERSLAVDSRFLICGARGLQIRDDSLSKEIMKECRRLGMDPRPPLHGLRKNAVMNLIEAGSDPREVQAITGQSLATIEHYAQGYKHERLAAAAILKLEKRGGG